MGLPGALTGETRSTATGLLQEWMACKFLKFNSMTLGNSVKVLDKRLDIKLFTENEDTHKCFVF